MPKLPFDSYMEREAYLARLLLAEKRATAMGDHDDAKDYRREFEELEQAPYVSYATGKAGAVVEG